MKSRLTALSLIVVACSVPVSGHAADSAIAPRVVKIRAGVENAMKFDVTTITAAPGERITVVLTNAGTLPKDAMGHNWILLVAGTDPVKFAQDAQPEGANGYIPTKSKDKILAYVGLLGPGESGEVTFQAPEKPGEYPFLCSFPAHCFVGMRGVLMVKK